MAIRLSKGLLYILAVIAGTVSWLPLSEWNSWWIRMLDFPRLQIGIISLLVFAALLMLFRKRNPADHLAVLILLAALGYHAWKLVPYTPLHSTMAVGVEHCAPGTQWKVLSANVQMTSHHPAALLQIVRHADPDLFLVMETNERWDRALSVLGDQMPYKVQHISSNYFGMHLFSKLPLVDPEIRFFSDKNVPAILTQVRLPGGALVRFFGIHPRPPHIGQSAADRDAQLMSAALAAREDGSPVVLAGDLNAVPWERTMRRLLRLGRLLDPRVGRGYRATYSTTSWLASWPLDHILFQDRIALMEFHVLPAFGSDHYPILSVLCLAQEVAALQSAPPVAPNDWQEALTAIQRGRAAETSSPRTPQKNKPAL